MGEREYKYNCENKYDEIRTGGGTKSGTGYHSVTKRCRLRLFGDHKCLFADKNTKTCPVSKAKKHKHTGKRKFRGKWVKI